MYTTIEPRLIALLNTDVATEPYSNATSPSLELPPLHDPNILKASGRPLLLEPDTSKRNGTLSTNSQPATKPNTLISSLEGDEDKPNKSKKRPADRTLGNSSPQSLRKILDDDTGGSIISDSKKRAIVVNSKDDFVQLPQPPKKQKAAKQVVPPIIIGLFEPPPQAALFPPIASSSFYDSHGRNTLNTLSPPVKQLDTAGTEECSVPAEKKSVSKDNIKRNAKARKKWTEEETNNLLLGVSKHGVGCWTDILGDSGLSFNERSAVDLKDRFRTCCPVELRGKGLSSQTDTQAGQKGTGKRPKWGKPKSRLMAENILIDDAVGDDPAGEEGSSPTLRKTRAHRRQLEDLAQLGIERPFRESQRRLRKPFSEQDDREIMMGYDMYGPAWTRILRDPRFHLQSRMSTDLRDRFRNRFPEKFRSEKAKESKTSRKSRPRPEEIELSSPTTSFQATSTREGHRIPQIVSAESKSDKTNTKALPLQVQMPHYNFTAFTEHTADSTDGLPFTQSFDWGNGSLSAHFPGNIGEMDISRLLLDEPWIDNSSKDKPSLTDINSIVTSKSDSLPQVPSFLNMLVSDEQLNLPSSDASFG